jgi:hypothetical protein
MSNVTLDAATLNAIAMPVSKVLPRMQNIDLINFAHAILALDAAAPALAEAHTDAPVRKAPARKAVESVKRNKPTVTVKPVKAAKGEQIANFAGKLMLCEVGTRSEGQARWLKENTTLDATMLKEISMVDASNYRAYASGRITAAQYNRLP